LCENTTLRKLDLSWNLIGEEGSAKEGIHKLLEAMTVNSTLHRLKLPEKYREYARKFPRFSQLSNRVLF